ncbi:MAG: Dna2/Cas4 domain-containing protein [Nitrosopumilus sp.]|jgi:CRISPR-associated exonuclease Cas4|nr:Dna2/Cas4 domain-containing protein [Nitrosopumilus sp.]|tara:strand:- start:59 stop:718 length:660 start_codon:yes stop_codon:yes gene_type:complete
MMGDRDFRTTIQTALASIGKELQLDIDPKNIQTIHLQEVVQCLRRSYFDRIDPIEIERRGFNELLSGLLRKLEYGSEPKEFEIDDIKLQGQTDMIVDDAIMLFRPAAQSELENPLANDVLFLNACLWIYDKTEGIVVYITGDRKETTFSLTRNKKMFEEVIRRVRVLNNLLKEQKAPILEPSTECSECQYYEKCFMKKKNSKHVDIGEMLGIGKLGNKG